MHRSLWVPRGRAEPFFPLCPHRPCWTISPETTVGLRPAWLAASVPSGIIPTRSPASVSCWPTICCGNFLNARSADRDRDDPRRRPQRASRNAAEREFCLPRLVQQLDAPEFLQCHAPPDSDSGTRLRFAPAVTSVLVTECPVLIGFVIAEHMGTEQPLHAIVDSRNRPPLNHRRLDEAVNLLQRLSCSRTWHAHSLTRIPSLRQVLETVYFITQ